MKILRIPTGYYSQLKWCNDEDCSYIFKTIFGLANGEKIEVENSMRGGLVCSIWREIVQMENRARAKKGKEYLNEDVATECATECATEEPTGGATKSNQIKSNQVKSNQEKSKKEIYGEYKNVMLTKKEYETLKEKFGDTLEEKIKQFDEGIEIKGYKYKSHYLAFLKWFKEEKKEILSF